MRCDEGALKRTRMRYLAERVGFEPTLRSPVNRISSAARSTSLPPLREICLTRPEVWGVEEPRG